MTDDVVSKVKRGILKLFGFVERMSDVYLVKRIFQISWQVNKTLHGCREIESICIIVVSKDFNTANDVLCLHLSKAPGVVIYMYIFDYKQIVRRISDLSTAFLLWYIIQLLIIILHFHFFHIILTQLLFT